MWFIEVFDLADMTIKHQPIDGRIRNEWAGRIGFLDLFYWISRIIPFPRDRYAKQVVKLS